MHNVATLDDVLDCGVLQLRQVLTRQAEDRGGFGRLEGDQVGSAGKADTERSRSAPSIRPLRMDSRSLVAVLVVNKGQGSASKGQAGAYRKKRTAGRHTVARKTLSVMTGCQERRSLSTDRHSWAEHGAMRQSRQAGGWVHPHRDRWSCRFNRGQGCGSQSGHQTARTRGWRPRWPGGETGPTGGRHQQRTIPEHEDIVSGRAQSS